MNVGVAATLIDENGGSTMHWAACHKHDSVIAALFEAIVEADGPVDKYVKRPLDDAVENGDVPVIMALIEAGAEVSRIPGVVAPTYI
jgi:ankyrin repeat protein